MKINKENDKNNQSYSPQENKKETYVDKANMDVQCHILIRDKDSGEVLLNKRG